MTFSVVSIKLRSKCLSYFYSDLFLLKKDSRGSRLHRGIVESLGVEWEETWVQNVLPKGRRMTSEQYSFSIDQGGFCSKVIFLKVDSLFRDIRSLREL